jgi:1-acyl-sn-glycerol-3-phosphate acyltransferase
MPRAPEPDPPGIPELPAGLIGSASPRAGAAYRLLRFAWRIGAFLLRFHVEVSGLENLPRTPDGRRTGGWIAAGLPHRAWIDPFLVWMVLPAEPRLVFFGDARTMARSPWRRWVIRRVGGIIPIPSRGGPRAFATHLAAAGEVIRGGAVFCLFPESGFPVPAGTARPIAAGLGYVALRTGAPIVPIVIGGNDLLFFGRRLVVRILPAQPWPAWAAVAATAELPGDLPVVPPPPGSRDERRLAHRIAAGFQAATADDVLDAHRSCLPPPGARLRGTRLTTLFR